MLMLTMVMMSVVVEISVDRKIISLGHAENVMKNGSILGRIDFRTTPHSLAAVVKIDGIGQIVQQFHNLARHLLATVVQMDRAVLDVVVVECHQSVTASTVVAEIAKVQFIVRAKGGGGRFECIELRYIGALDRPRSVRHFLFCGGCCRNRSRRGVTRAFLVLAFDVAVAVVISV